MARETMVCSDNISFHFQPSPIAIQNKEDDIEMEKFGECSILLLRFIRPTQVCPDAFMDTFGY